MMMSYWLIVQTNKQSKTSQLQFSNLTTNYHKTESCRSKNHKQNAPTIVTRKKKFHKGL
ncbi:hypothetical protein Hanom_Chr13g01222531 [Helianthus anomalus]